jgi:nitroreductase
MTFNIAEKLSDDVVRFRKPDNEISALFPNRWSPRAMTGETISPQELMNLFEAARWAPSAFNNQPWHFLYAFRDTANWQLFYNLINEGNRLWTKNAAVLIVVLSKKERDYQGKIVPIPTHSFDAGAAWENLALQGSLRGLVVHAMSGFDYTRAKAELSVPDNYQVEAMIAVGRHGKLETLTPQDQVREFPSDRKKITDFVTEGKFRQ